MPLADMIASHRLCWLGHLARMNEFRLPKQLLFKWVVALASSATWA